MAVINYQFFRDWIFHNLSEIGDLVTEMELGAVIAEQTRIITSELGLSDNRITSPQTMTSNLNYLVLPTDCAVLHSIYYDDGVEERFIPILQYGDGEKRTYYTDNGLDYMYVVGRTLYPSWTLTADIDIILHYQNFLTEAYIAVDGTGGALGSATTHIPVNMSHVLRYAVLADLMLVHSRKQEAMVKAQLYQKKFEQLIRNARKNLQNISPTREYRKIRNY